MASTDARPVARKNAAYRVTFPIYDADGDLVTGATGLDSEVSKDGGTYADCTNEATEIATASGTYYLDLTATEMNADTTAIIVKTSSSGAKTTPIILYPQEGGDIRVDMNTWLGDDMFASDTAGYPKVTIKNGTGAGELATTSGGLALTSTGVTAILTALYASTLENNGTLTFKTALRVILSGVLGRTSVSGSTATYKTPDNAKTRATVVTDSTNQRTSVTLDGTD